MKQTHIPDTNLGVYVALSDGRYVVDEEGRQLSIQSMRGDKKRYMELVKTAHQLGLEKITVEFVADARQVTLDEYEEQVDRLKNGLTPDPYDLGALIDQYNESKE